MWAVGVVMLLILTSLATAFCVPRKPDEAANTLLDIPQAAANIAQLSGNLAALSLAGAVFIATLAPDSPAFGPAIGLFIFSFLTLVGAAMALGTTPKSGRSESPSFADAQNVSYLLANCAFFLGIAMSWLGLRLLLLAIRQESLASIVTWVLLFSIVAGSIRLATHFYRQARLSGLTCLILVALGFGCALVYRLVIAEAWTDLWPNEDEAVRLSVLAFLVAGTGYGVQTLLLAFHGHRRWDSYLLHFGQKWLAAYLQAVVTVIMLVWLAVKEAR